MPKPLLHIIARPSRFDKEGLLAGRAGSLLFYTLNMQPGTYNLLSTQDPKPQSGVVVCLGEEALKLYTNEVTLTEQRGSPLVKDALTIIASFHPQDVLDPKNYEAKYNEHSLENFETDGDDETDSKTTHGSTQRKNYYFWFKHDIEKAKRIALNGLTEYPEPDYHIDVPANEMQDFLYNHRDCELYFDIETDHMRMMTCFAVMFVKDNKPTPVKTFSCYDYTGSINPRFPRVLMALARALSRNEVIIHNSMFDLSVLVDSYRLPLTNLRIYDTMIAHQRVYRDVEKSLGHCISLYTDLPYHKNEGVFEPRNNEQEHSLHLYNAKDVVSMYYVRRAIDARAEELQAEESIAQANSSIAGYLVLALYGIYYDEEKRLKLVDECERRMLQILRIVKILTGRELNPRSPKMVAAFLYDHLGNKRPPAEPTNEKNLVKLLPNPVINCIFKYRELGKVLGTLNFTPLEAPKQIH